MTDERELTEAEISAWEREHYLADPEVSADQFPRLWNISAGSIYQRVIRTLEPNSPEYVTVPLPPGAWGDDRLAMAVVKWNLMWEGAQFRRRMFSEEDLPPQLREIAERGDLNVIFVPKTDSRYYEYAPLFHLLPRPTVERYGLPLLRSGQWPYMAEIGRIEPFIPRRLRDAPRTCLGSGNLAAPDARLATAVILWFGPNPATSPQPRFLAPPGHYRYGRRPSEPPRERPRNRRSPSPAHRRFSV